MNKVSDVDIVNYIVNNNATLKETSEYFNVSLSTIKKRLSSIKSQLHDDSDIKNNLLKVANNNQNIGRIKGGLSNNSGIKMTDDIDSIAKKAMIIMSNNMTLEEASISFNIPTSTLHEHFRLLQTTEYADIYNDLQSLFEYHKKNSSGVFSPILFKIQQKYSQKSEKNKESKLR